MAQEFLTLIKEHYFILLYLITWIVAVVFYKRYFDTVLKYFPIFIIYTFFTELLGYLIKHTDEFQFFSDYRYSWHNVIIFNLYSIVSFSFFYYIYWKTLKQKTHKKRAQYGAVIALFGYLVSLFFQNPFHQGLYWADLLASMVLLHNIALYFMEKKKEKSPYPIKHNLLFWVSLGLAIFHIFFPFIFIAAYDFPVFYFDYNLYGFLKVLIVTMYLLFVIGFFMGKRKAFR